MIGLLTDRANAGDLNDEAIWRAVRKSARRLGITAMAAYQARPLVAGDRRIWCDQALRTGWQLHTQSLNQLCDVVRLFDEAGISMLALKGPALARRYYQPAFTRRPSADLDIAVRRADLNAALDLLASRGYRAVTSLAESDARSHHIEMIHPGRTKLELHFRLSHGSLGLSIDDVFERATRLELAAGYSVLVPGAADQLLHALLHGGQGLATFFHIYEIRHLWKDADGEVRAEALDRAAEFGFRGVAALADVASTVLWGEPLLFPAERERMKTWLAGRIDARLYSRYLEHSDPGRRINLLTRMDRRFLDLQITDSPQRAAYFIARLIPSAAWLLWRMMTARTR